MKKLLLLLVVVSLVSYSDDGEHDPAPGRNDGQRTVVKKIKDKSAKLFEYISACMAGPAASGAAAAAGAGAAFSATADAPPAAGASASAGNAQNGASIFNGKCMECHATGKAPALTGKNGTAVLNGFELKDMATRAGLTPQQKEDVKAFLTQQASTTF